VSEKKTIEAVVNGDARALKDLLAAGANVNEQDEQGWTPLNWAVGRGDVEAVRLLLDHGADVTLTGRDNRTPLMIAKAAARKEIAEMLREAEAAQGVWIDPRETQPYCRAYYLGQLRKFDGWSEGRINWTEESSTLGGNHKPEAIPLTDEDVVYLHQDFTVTKSMWHDESVIANQVTPEWEEFCKRELQFAVPEDLL
jgi:uncharacterized protein